MATPRWGGLRPEPYDPDARDADGDGIVQEQTAWERPVGTNLVDELGRAITRGAQSGTRPRNMRVVDGNGNSVDYTPTYGTAPQAPTPNQPGAATALADHGAGSLRERGVRDVRALSRPTPPPQPKPTPAPARAADTPKSPASPTVEKVADGANPAGLTSASTDRPELVEPQKPRSPFKPSPPPLSGRAQEIADEADGDFGKFMELLDKEGYVVFDYETTGLQDGNIPVQIGAVKIKDGEIVERLNLFTNPRRPLSDWSKENLKNKDGDPLTDEWLGGQMDLAEAHKQLADFMGDSIIVAHNLPYDGEIIERMMADGGIEHSPAGSIDTLMLLRSAVPKGDGETGPERHTLGALAEFFDVNLGDDAHTADADSEAAALVLQRAMAWSKDNDSDPEIFDATKQKELFDAATKKYEAQRTQYEADLKKYRADLDEYQRSLAKASEPTPDYQMGHQPNEDGPRAHDLTENEWLTDDVYKHPERYSGADKAVVRETVTQLGRVKGDPDAKVTIYRWAPEGSRIEPGNWVSLSKTYAEQHGSSNAGGQAGSVIAIEVPAREVRFAGDDLAEFGWWPNLSNN